MAPLITCDWLVAKWRCLMGNCRARTGCLCIYQTGYQMDKRGNRFNTAESSCLKCSTFASQRNSSFKVILSHIRWRWFLQLAACQSSNITDRETSQHAATSGQSALRTHPQQESSHINRAERRHIVSLLFVLVVSVKTLWLEKSRSCIKGARYCRTASLLVWGKCSLIGIWKNGSEERRYCSYVTATILSPSLSVSNTLTCGHTQCPVYCGGAARGRSRRGAERAPSQS